MKSLTFTLRQRPDQRLDLSPLVPHFFPAGRPHRSNVSSCRRHARRVNVGEVFRLRLGEPAKICIEGAGERLDHVGQAMTGGEIVRRW